jgi:hypothetical protein
MDLAGYRPKLNEVAALFGKSSRWISDLRAKGEMPEDGATLAEFFAAWGSLSAASAGGIKGKPIDLAKARSAAAKAEQDEIKTAAMKGLYLPRAGVTSAVQAAFARVRAKLLALPSKSAPIVFGMKSAVAVQEKLTELVHEALLELAATNVGIEEAGAEGGHSAAHGGVGGDRGGRGGLVAGAGAPAEADGQPVGGSEPGTQPGRKRRTR